MVRFYDRLRHADGRKDSRGKMFSPKDAKEDEAIRWCTIEISIVSRKCKLRKYPQTLKLKTLLTQESIFQVYEVRRIMSLAGIDHKSALLMKHGKSAPKHVFRSLNSRYEATRLERSLSIFHQSPQEIL